MAKNVHAACKVDEETRDRLDALLPHLSTDYHRATRSDVLRAAVLKGLPALEQAHGIALTVERTLTNEEREAHDEAIEGPVAARKWKAGEKKGEDK
jgi:hypothetical protein